MRTRPALRRAGRFLFARRRIAMNPRRLLDLGNLLIVAGALLLVRPATHLATARRAQSSGLPAASSLAPSGPIAPRRASEGEAIARLEVPRLGLSLVVFEGTSDATLQKGPGHVPGTAWPGDDDAGNCVLTGHRDTFFRRLSAVRKNDVVRVQGPSGTSTYRLEDRRIVRPEEVSVLAPTSEARLTLITCYPFRWIGSAPYRLVWSARRIEENENAARASLQSR